jgi:hypothetical protein
MVARSDFWFLKNRKAKKTLLGGGYHTNCLDRQSKQKQPTGRASTLTRAPITLLMGSYATNKLYGAQGALYEGPRIDVLLIKPKYKQPH